MKILTTSGEDLQSVETIFFRNGETEYVCLWKDVFTADEQSNHTVKIIFPYKANIYDVRTKRYYGFTDEIKTEIAPLKPRVFALVPYKIDGIVLTLEKNECKPGAVISYNVRVESSAKEPSPHVIRLEVINPVGKQINYYGTNLLAENGKGCYGYIRTSLNEEKQDILGKAYKIFLSRAGKIDNKNNPCLEMVSQLVTHSYFNLTF